MARSEKSKRYSLPLVALVHVVAAQGGQLKACLDYLRYPPNFAVLPS